MANDALSKYNQRWSGACLIGVALTLPT